MLPQKYRTCKDKVGANLEVISGAGVKSDRWKNEIKNQKDKDPAIGGPSQIHENK